MTAEGLFIVFHGSGEEHWLSHNAGRWDALPTNLLRNPSLSARPVIQRMLEAPC